MPTLVHYLPLLTTALAVPFTWRLWRHWRRKPQALYLAWWAMGVFTYGLGTLVEGCTTLFGWHESLFKTWYIAGALLGGAPLAQGTVYLFLKRRTAHLLTGVVGTVILIAAVCVLLSPIVPDRVEPYRLSGTVLAWQWVRGVSPFINLYAFVFLVGGAAWSAWQYARHRADTRMWGNGLIALGALLPGIGGTATRLGHVEVLYLTELIGLVLIWAGYALMTQAPTPSIHAAQRGNLSWCGSERDGEPTPTPVAKPRVDDVVID